MFTLDLIINPIIVAAALIGGILVGFTFRRRKLAKLNSRIAQLEDEMMSSHAEILELQKEYVRLESNTADESIPVIPMKHGNKDNPNPKGKASK